ncbi:MAG TPA: hypothetical protein DCY13_09580 [Verrucomicrobiales bacterium]|nr:hypothetical protein [Verrucomicrobiales bacterium]
MVSRCIVEDGFNGTDIWTVDLQFVAPGSNNFSLTPGSPAIDLGSNDVFANLTVSTRDIDGKPRLLDGDHDGQTAVDLGAPEFGRFAVWTQIQRTTGGPLELRALSSDAAGVVVQETSNFIDWADVGTMTQDGDTLTVTLPAADAFAGRFFRARLP